MNAAKLAEFWDRGFCCLEGVMESSELDPIRSVIERSVEARASKLQRNGHISTTHPAAPLEERWSLIAADAVAVGAPFRPGNWGQSQMLDKSIYDLLTDRRLTDIAATVVGQNVAAHGDYWIRPSTKVVAASGVPMHQDSSYYAEALPPERAAEMYRPFGAGVRAPESLIGGSERVIVSLWIPLVDVDESNGCLRFVAGSHRMGLLPFRQKVDSFGSAGSALEPTDPPESYGPIVPVPMRVGSVLVFHNNVMHGSEGFERERHVRWSIDLRYGPASQPFDWHGNPDWLEEWPPFVARVDDPLDEPAAAAAADASGSDEKLQVTPWEEWERKWQTPRHTSGPRL